MDTALMTTLIASIACIEAILQMEKKEISNRRETMKRYISADMVAVMITGAIIFGLLIGVALGLYSLV